MHTYATQAQTPSLIPYLAKSGKYGYCDKNLNLKIPAIYDNIEPFYEGMAKVYSNYKNNFIDTTGKILPLNVNYYGIDNFIDGMAMVEDSKRGYGFIDKTGNEIISCKYKKAMPFSEGLAYVISDSFAGFIDKTGKEVITLLQKYPTLLSEYPKTRVGDFSDDFAYIWNGNSSGYIDKTGKEIIAFVYCDVSDFKEGLAWVQKCNPIPNQKGYKVSHHFIDKTGKIVLTAPEGGSLSLEFSNGLVSASNSTQKYGFMDKTGKLVVEIKYDFAYDFSDDLSMVSSDGKYSYIDKNGKTIISLAQYNIEDNQDNISQFSEGFAEIIVGEKYGFINKIGIVVIQPKYLDADKFINGLSLVTLDKEFVNGVEAVRKYFYIDKTGKEYREL